MHIFIAGYPHSVGGAGPHCWHTVRVWRRAGLDVCFLPLSPVDKNWDERIKSIGCNVDYRLIGNQYSKINEIDGLPGGIVVSFCDSIFVEISRHFKVIGCKIIWLGCMPWLMGNEVEHYKVWGPYTRYVFQSQFQEMSISDGLKLYGYTDDSLIRIPSPLMTDEYQYNPFPHNVAEPFKIGRLSRPDPAKFTSNMWEVYGKIKTNIRVYLMGWSDSVQNVVGLPPVWAECHPAGHMLVQKFMDNIHCMVQVGRVPENRPRSCLEAMACGVPVVAPADSGWKELIIHGETGFLCNSPEEMSHYIAKMADDEEYRLNIARNAADRLSVVASESSIASQWIDLFEAVSNEA